MAKFLIGQAVRLQGGEQIMHICKPEYNVYTSTRHIWCFWVDHAGRLNRREFPGLSLVAVEEFPILTEDKEHVSFEEALIAMKSGASIRRAGNHYKYRIERGDIYCGQDPVTGFGTYAVLAEDWVICKTVRAEEET